MSTFFNKYRQFIADNRKLNEDSLFLQFKNEITDFNHLEKDQFACDNIDSEFLHNYYDPVNFWRFLLYLNCQKNQQLFQMNLELINSLKRI